MSRRGPRTALLGTSSAARLRRWLAEGCRSTKWRLIASTFVICKVAAPLIVLVTFVMLGRDWSDPAIPPASQFSPFDMWFRWDSEHYLRLAREPNYFAPLTAEEHAVISQAATGASAEVPPSLHRFTFAPLYPALSRLMGGLLGGHFHLGMLVIANIAFLACLILVYDLAAAMIPDGSPGDAVILLALAPTGFLLQAGLSESTFLALVLGCFVMAERQRWGWATVLGFAAGLTRSMGLLIALPLLFVLLRQNGYRVSKANLREYATALPALAAPEAAWGAFMVYCRAMTGDWLAYNHLQHAGWWVTMGLPFRWMASLFGPVDQELLKAWLVLATVVLLIVAAFRVPGAYTLLGAVLIVPPLMMSNWDQSGLRYLLMAIPVALLGAAVLRRFPHGRSVIFAALAVTQALLLIAWNLPWTYMIV